MSCHQLAGQELGWLTQVGARAVRFDWVVQPAWAPMLQGHAPESVSLFDEEDQQLYHAEWAEFQNGHRQLRWSTQFDPSTVVLRVVARAGQCWQGQRLTTWRYVVERYGSSNRNANHDEGTELRLAPTLAIEYENLTATACVPVPNRSELIHFLVVKSDDGRTIAGYSAFDPSAARDGDAFCGSWTIPAASRNLMPCVAVANTMHCSARFDLASAYVAWARRHGPAPGECPACFPRSMLPNGQLEVRLTPFDTSSWTPADTPGYAHFWACTATVLWATASGDGVAPMLLGLRRDDSLRFAFPGEAGQGRLLYSQIRAFLACEVDAAEEASTRSAPASIGALWTTQFNVSELLAALSPPPPRAPPAYRPRSNPNVTLPAWANVFIPPWVDSRPEPPPRRAPPPLLRTPNGKTQAAALAAIMLSLLAILLALARTPPLQAVVARSRRGRVGERRGRHGGRRGERRGGALPDDADPIRSDEEETEPLDEHVEHDVADDVAADVAPQLEGHGEQRLGSISLGNGLVRIEARARWAADELGGVGSGDGRGAHLGAIEARRVLDLLRRLAGGPPAEAPSQAAVLELVQQRGLAFVNEELRAVELAPSRTWSQADAALPPALPRSGSASGNEATGARR